MGLLLLPAGPAGRLKVLVTGTAAQRVGHKQQAAETRYIVMLKVRTTYSS